jgi:hypothetical protein
MLLSKRDLSLFHDEVFDENENQSSLAKPQRPKCMRPHILRPSICSRLSQTCGFSGEDFVYNLLNSKSIQMVRNQSEKGPPCITRLLTWIVSRFVGKDHGIGLVTSMAGMGKAFSKE